MWLYIACFLGEEPLDWKGNEDWGRIGNRPPCWQRLPCRLGRGRRSAELRDLLLQAPKSELQILAFVFQFAGVRFPRRTAIGRLRDVWGLDRIVRMVMVVIVTEQVFTEVAWHRDSPLLSRYEDRPCGIS
jgi:hypothetical protein